MENNPMTKEFKALETECNELKVMYYLAQAMEMEGEMEDLSDDERGRIVIWFTDKYRPRYDVGLMKAQEAQVSL